MFGKLKARYGPANNLKSLKPTSSQYALRATLERTSRDLTLQSLTKSQDIEDNKSSLCQSQSSKILIMSLCACYS